MDELIDIVNLQGQPTGNACLKSFAHQNGILHASVHIWFYTTDDKILIQKRKENKDTFPNLWDVSVAGHIGSGETPIEAAIREVKEEIDLTVDKKELKYIDFFEEKHHHPNGIIDYEIHHIYIAQLKIDIKELTPQQEEVSDLKLIDITTLEKNYSDKNTYVPHTNQYYNYIIKKLKARH
ncbi:NUDIX hydrolase [Wenyingzhuangia sp. IMCC45467]